MSQAVSEIVKPGPPPHEHELVETAAALLDEARPEETLRWAFDEFRDEVAIATGFGAEGVALIDMAVRINPRVDVFFIDTDFLFAETLELRRRAFAWSAQRPRPERNGVLGAPHHERDAVGDLARSVSQPARDPALADAVRQEGGARQRDTGPRAERFQSIHRRLRCQGPRPARLGRAHHERSRSGEREQAHLNEHESHEQLDERESTARRHAAQPTGRDRYARHRIIGNRIDRLRRDMRRP